MAKQMTPVLKGALVGTVLITVLWLLAPQRTIEAEDGAVPIVFMGPEGPLRGALEDAVREFELLSQRRHAEDPSYPVYRVIAGQHASRNQVEDPTRFIVSVAGGMPPDVIFFDRFAISEWAARGAFQPLDDRIARDEAAWAAWQADPTRPEPWPGAREEPPRVRGASPRAPVEPIRATNFYEPCWEEAIYRNPRTGQAAVYGIPNNADNRVLLYNKDILIRHGYTNEAGEARPPRTWEELEEMAITMTERDEQGRIKTIGFIPNYGNSWLYLYGWQAGGEFMSEDGLRCTLNHPRIVEALEFMTRIYDKLGGASEVYAFQNTFQADALDPFIQGKVAMKIDGVWIMSSLAFYGRDLNFGAAPPPMPARELAAGRHPISWVGGWAYAIPANARNPDGAWELIRFLVSRRAHEIMLESEHFTYASQGRPYIPRQYPNREHNEYAFRRYVLENPNLEPRFKEAMRQFNDLLPYSRFRPVTPVGQKLWNAQIWAMEDAIFHKKTPKESLDYYTALVQRDLDQILHPPPGRPIRNWRWFFAVYGVVIVILAVGAWWWDTHRRGLEGRRAAYLRAEWRGGLLCAAPFLVGLVVFTAGPMLFSVIISFCSFDVLNPALFTGLRNYVFMLRGDELFWKSLGNTLFMVIGVPLGMAVGLALAVLLNLKVRGVAVWRTFFYLPSIVPAVASSILWMWIFNPQSGLLNAALAALGIRGPNWLQDENTSKWALILMGLWGSGGGMIIWLAGLKGISESYYEAAAIDGANAWQRFRYITIPMLTPYIFFNLVMGLIGTFQIFTQAFIMTGGGPVNSTLFYAYHLFNNAFRYLHMGYAAAMAWFLFFILVILTAIQMRLSTRWVHYEGE